MWQIRGTRPVKRVNPTKPIEPIGLTGLTGHTRLMGHLGYMGLTPYYIYRGLELGRFRCSGEGNDIADVLHTGDEEDEPFETETETGMGA